MSRFDEMSSKAVTEPKAEQESQPNGWRQFDERAPSAMRQDEPRLARTLGMCGLMLLTLGSLTLFFHFSGRGTRVVGAGWGSAFALLGLGLMIFHAARDAELQVRRLYGLFGALWLVIGVSSIFWPVTTEAGTQIGTYFLQFGIPCLGVALLFLIPFARNESEARLHDATVLLLGIIGAAAALAGFVAGSFSVNFLVPLGLLVIVLGLGYLWAFVGLHGSPSPLGYRAALGMGALGILVLIVALIWSILPPLFYSWGWLEARPEPYLIPRGLLLMTLGAVYAATSAGLISDNRLVVLTRRELAAFFYSPIAYIVLFGFTGLGWWQYYTFLDLLTDPIQRGGEPLVEPVISYYVISWPTVISMIAIVPVLTMRLLSEEKRTGTMEVLLTAPLDETSVVVSKFLASLIFFLVLWVPWGLFLVALRIQGGEPFDYRPLLSFFFALAATGAGLLGMGLFFSSLTRNQISAFILTFVAVVPLTFIFFLKRDLPSDSAWRTILTYICYVDLWIESVQGTLSPRYLLFHISAAVFWLFMTIKVLEARKWS
jgi:ABC-type transport system involved in multi-copper enzyme maturation permease subunit